MKILFILFLVFGALTVGSAKWADSPGQAADDYARAFVPFVMAVIAAICGLTWLLSLVIHYLFG